MGSMEVEKMLKLTEQCLERIKSFTAKQQEPPPPSSTSSPNQTSSSTLPPVVASTLKTTAEKTGEPVVSYNNTDTMAKLADLRYFQGSKSMFVCYALIGLIVQGSYKAIIVSQLPKI